MVPFLYHKKNTMETLFLLLIILFSFSLIAVAISQRIVLKKSQEIRKKYNDSVNDYIELGMNYMDSLIEKEKLVKENKYLLKLTEKQRLELSNNKKKEKLKKFKNNLQKNGK